MRRRKHYLEAPFGAVDNLLGQAFGPVPASVSYRPLVLCGDPAHRALTLGTTVVSSQLLLFGSLKLQGIHMGNKNEVDRFDLLCPRDALSRGG